MVEDDAAERKQISAAVGTELHRHRAIRRRGGRDSALAPSLRQRHGLSDDVVVVDLFGLLPLGWRGFWRGRQSFAAKFSTGGAEGAMP